MSRNYTVNGVPDSLRQDGWWLTCGDIQQHAVQPSTTASDRSKPTILRPFSVPCLLLLIWLADWLFWQHLPGVSIAVFALVLATCVMAAKPGGATRCEWIVILAAQLACNLPVIDQVQPLSMLFTVTGIAGLVVWVCYGRLISGWQTIWAMLRVSTVGALLLPRVLVYEARTLPARQTLRQRTQSLILPASVGLIFLILLSVANPVLEQFVVRAAWMELLNTDHLWRVTFWAMVATFTWPYLNLTETWLGPVAKAPEFKPTKTSFLASLITLESLRNSLLLFNLLFLVQTVMDIGVLTGGMTLPNGMTYAGYAHRGAYPLMITAILAGLFAVATHRTFKHSRYLRILMYVWLIQNLFLVVTAAIRLGLYADAYDLTHLRVAAFIWMGLVLIGLSLIMLQITREKSIAWLIRLNGISLMTTLYLCCFVNFAYLIAEFNFTNNSDLSDLDTEYICSLGEQALPVIRAIEAHTGGAVCYGTAWYLSSKPVFQPIENWRGWGFRKWRLQVYLNAETQG